MGRLPGFDYKHPFFYMVTLKKAAVCDAFIGAFSEIAEGEVVANATTRTYEQVIRRFHETWYCIEPIRDFVIMPDHIHLIVKMRNVEKRVSLAVVVRQLIKALERVAHVGAERRLQNSAVLQGSLRESLAARNCKTAKSDAVLQGSVLQGTLRESLAARNCDRAKNDAVLQGAVLQGSLREPIFEPNWHDWIVKKKGQLAAFVRYVRENPKRAWLRRLNRRYFAQVRRVSFARREWFAYGNTAILELPVIEPFVCSRKWAEGGPEWREAVGRAERIGPGGAGCGTFMSPCEKACGNAIYKAGGSLIVLSPEGFGERWHPPRNKEALCAKGRMLFLSLYETQAAKPDRATLYRRCHEMGDLFKH